MFADGPSKSMRSGINLIFENKVDGPSKSMRSGINLIFENKVDRSQAHGSTIII